MVFRSYWQTWTEVWAEVTHAVRDGRGLNEEFARRIYKDRTVIEDVYVVVAASPDKRLDLIDKIIDDKVKRFTNRVVGTSEVMAFCGWACLSGFVRDEKRRMKALKCASRSFFGVRTATAEGSGLFKKLKYVTEDVLGSDWQFINAVNDGEKWLMFLANITKKEDLPAVYKGLIKADCLGMEEITDTAKQAVVLSKLGMAYVGAPELLLKWYKDHDYIITNSKRRGNYENIGLDSLAALLRVTRTVAESDQEHLDDWFNVFNNLKIDCKTGSHSSVDAEVRHGIEICSIMQGLFDEEREMQLCVDRTSAMTPGHPAVRPFFVRQKT